MGKAVFKFLMGNGKEIKLRYSQIIKVKPRCGGGSGSFWRAAFLGRRRVSPALSRAPWGAEPGLGPVAPPSLPLCPDGSPCPVTLSGTMTALIPFSLFPGLLAKI